MMNSTLQIAMKDVDIPLSSLYPVTWLVLIISSNVVKRIQWMIKMAHHALSSNCLQMVTAVYSEDFKLCQPLERSKYSECLLLLAVIFTVMLLLLNMFTLSIALTTNLLDICEPINL